MTYRPPMPAPSQSSEAIDVGPERVWCTEIDLGKAMPPILTAPNADYNAARVLVRFHGEPLMFQERRLTHDRLETGDLLKGIGVAARSRLVAHVAADLGSVDRTLTGELTVNNVAEDCRRTPAAELSVTVVVCTRDRGPALATCLAGLAAIDNRLVDFLIVDNAPTDNQSAEAFDRVVGRDPRFRYLVEPRPGLSCARNRGLAEATGQVIAFTDDDVSVDSGWIDGMLVGFDRRSDVACVTSMVCTASLLTPAEHYFDSRVSWAVRCEPKIYDGTPPDGDPLYPYAPGLFGTGAGMAFRTAVIRELGGFDEALGAGTRTAGGEDLDAFVRVLLAGFALSYEPSSLVWHHHRSDLPNLRKQMYSYGTGLAAFVTKHLVQRETRGPLLHRIPRGVARLWSVSKPNAGAVPHSEIPTRSLIVRELWGMAVGPALYGLARRRIPGQSDPRNAAQCDGQPDNVGDLAKSGTAHGPQ